VFGGPHDRRPVQALRALLWHRGRSSRARPSTLGPHSRAWARPLQGACPTGRARA
jgi:hypothetical protein